MPKNILDLEHDEAQKFFLDEKHYFSNDLPIYFTFDDLLQDISKKIKDENLSDFCTTIIKEETSKQTKDNPQNHENVNYKIYTNKDGQYSWRLLQLIHPVLYVDLVHIITKKQAWKKITKRFEQFQQH